MCGVLLGCDPRYPLLSRVEPWTPLSLPPLVFLHPDAVNLQFLEKTYLSLEVKVQDFSRKEERKQANVLGRECFRGFSFDFSVCNKAFTAIG